MPNRPELEQNCRQYDLFEHKLRECATYLAHLRHGGFPSPLLDAAGRGRRIGKRWTHGATQCRGAAASRRCGQNWKGTVWGVHAVSQREVIWILVGAVLIAVQ